MRLGIISYIVMTVLVLLYNLKIKQRSFEYVVIYIGLSIIVLIGLMAIYY